MGSNYEKSIPATKNSKNHRAKDKNRRNKGACLGPMKEGDGVLVKNKSERGGTSKLRSFWEDKVAFVVEREGDEAIRPAHNHEGRVRILHSSMLMTV